ncbi:HD domain-containing protein [Neiella sp. HB171785]|uniref:HD domain-containing protein n=1 Tax=Neiella litorisoli TaxID=2771431 RepID=A0A8J6ULK9_9GAMM|nr:HD domain-containing protein [Neiella litorisoli]
MTGRHCIQYGFLLLLAMLLSMPSSADDEAFHILVLHSYSTDFQWTNEIHQGITETITTQSPQSRIRVEFMDTKNIFHPDYLAHLAELYTYKYADHKPDAIILSDNNAMAFYNRYGATLFPQAKVVAGGINGALPPPLQSPVHSVIAELVDHKQTLSFALQLRPQAQRIYVIADSSTTGIAIRQEVEQIAEQFDDSVEFVYLNGLTLAQLRAETSRFSRHDIVYLLPYFRAADGSSYHQNEVGMAIAESSKTPVFVSWAFQMAPGVVGGRVMSAQNIGHQAATSVLRLLRAEFVESFQTNLALDESLFDYQALRRHHIPFSDLPSGARIVNRPQNFWDEHKKVMIPGLLVIAVLLLILVLLLLNLKKQRALNTNNRQLMELDREVIDTQRELLTILGEVIEVRSHETRNHVTRVAKVSYFLGTKLGLSEETLKMLEAASPMHDVGKIGIPENILNKPGQLTDDEYQIMRTHAQIGHNILHNSDRELLQMACVIAHQHHEYWDGSGYPQGLKGEQIHLFARITTLADIYDAISSDRCYKDAWPEEDVLHYILEQRGKIFDPKLVDIFMANIDDIRSLRNQYV